MATKTPLKLVCIGGGTGLPQLLMGMKLLSRIESSHSLFGPENLTAIVTAFDDGGSSGRLMQAYHTLPPGDLRNCLVALSDERSEPLLTRFFDHRFREDEHESLAGHSVGNLLLLALSQVYGGDIRKALLAVRNILPVQGTIFFPTLQPAVLCARLRDGTVVRGESNIATRDERSPIAEIFLEHREMGATNEFSAMEGVVEAILAADVITLGPGSLYTSILPHFLVSEVAQAVRESHSIKIYVCNLMTEVGETDGFRISDHVANLERSAGIHIDAVVANDTPVPASIRQAYELETYQKTFRGVTRGLELAFARALTESTQAEQFAQEIFHGMTALQGLAEELRRPGARVVQVLPEPADPLPPRIRLITTDLLADVELADSNGGRKRVIRHDPIKLARAILHSFAELGNSH